MRMPPSTESVATRPGSASSARAHNFEVGPTRALFYRDGFAGSDPGTASPLPDGPFRIPTDRTGVYTLTIVSRRKADPGNDAKEKILWEAATASWCPATSWVA